MKRTKATANEESLPRGGETHQTAGGDVPPLTLGALQADEYPVVQEPDRQGIRGRGCAIGGPLVTSGGLGCHACDATASVRANAARPGLP